VEVLGAAAAAGAAAAGVGAVGVFVYGANACRAHSYYKGPGSSSLLTGGWGYRA